MASLGHAAAFRGLVRGHEGKTSPFVTLEVTKDTGPGDPIFLHQSRYWHAPQVLISESADLAWGQFPCMAGQGWRHRLGGKAVAWVCFLLVGHGGFSGVIL